MIRYHLLAISIFVLGLALTIIGKIKGDVQGGFTLIFPFIMGTGIYLTLGFILIIIGMLLLLFSFSYGSSNKDITIFDKDVNSNQKIHGGGLILIGPIPFLIGSNWKFKVLLLVVAVFIVILFIII